MRLFKEFQSTSSTGKQAGKSPSQRMTLNDINYQVKRSNSTKNWRRWFGYDPDPSDLVGEFIASKIGEHLAASIYGVGEEAGELSPKVELVLDVKNKELKLASKYLNAGDDRFSGGTLDEIWRGTLPQSAEEIKGHAIISSGGSSLQKDDPRKLLKLDEEITTRIGGKEVKISLSKKQLFQSMKLSMLLGDHDVNPGNLYVTYNKLETQARVCRIDYGHAFSDLIKKWGRGPGKDHSPKLGEGRGVVLDSLNREKINGGQSKLARDYRGIIPDHDLAGILRENVDFGTVKNATQECKKEFSAFLCDHTPGIGRLKNKVLRCFSTLSSRMGFGKFETKQNRLEQVLARAEEYTQNNAKEMKSVANLIDIQAYIQDVVRGTITPESANQQITELYGKDDRYLLGKSPLDPVEWVKMEGEKKPAKCSLVDYIALRAKSCNIEEKTRLEALARIVQQSQQVTTQIESQDQVRNKSQQIEHSLQSHQVDQISSQPKPIIPQSWQEKVGGKSSQQQKGHVPDWR